MYLFLAVTFCCITINAGMNTVGIWQLTEDMTSDSESHGDIAYVKLVSKPRHRRDLSKSDYHILEINVPAQQKNFTVHLTKETAFVSPDLSTTIHSEDGKQEPLIQGTDKSHECLYTGVVTEPGNVEGTAHLSACDKSAPGFSGIIEVDQKHFVIQPAIADSASENASTLLHHPNIMHVIKETTNLTNSDTKINDDTKTRNAKYINFVATEMTQKIVLTILTNLYLNARQFNQLHLSTSAIVAPQKLVEEALALRAKERNQSESSNTNQIENNFQANLMDLDGHKNDNIMASHILPLATKPTSSNKNGNKILDVAIFCDASMYLHFQKMYSKDATKKLTDYVLTIVGAMNIMYKAKSLNVPLNIRLAHLEIMKSDPSEIKADLHDDKFMAKFCLFAEKKNTNGQLWDHNVLLTAHDLIFDRIQEVQGVAYQGFMCTPLSCSVAEATSLNVVYVISHELLHSLGVHHDGENHAASCDPRKYIMSPTTGEGKTIWSSCSSKKAKELLDSGVKNMLASHGLPDCLNSASKAKSISYASKNLPGEKYPLKEQCRFNNGKSATPYTQGSPYKDVCRMLYCSIPKGFFTTITQAHPALEGTSCGSSKARKS